MSREPKTFFIETYGCQMNLYDSAKMRAILKSHGWDEAEGPEGACLVVINSCAVRGHAEERVLGRVAELAGFKRRRPEAKLVLAGCVAQEHGRALLERFPHLDAVIGTESYDCLPEMLAAGGGTPDSRISQCRPEPGREVLPDFGGRATAMVAAMRGCDNFCSYCIVPFVRGRERSRDPREVLAEIEGLVSQGVREVTLVGQNVNSYRWAGTNFPRLLRQVCQVVGLERVRFITSHPKDLGQELLEAMSGEPRACEHLHLPLQSGSDRVLSLMNRGYAAADYLEKAGQARSLVPGLSLTTDVIAGFPGETEEDFRMTLEALEQAGFDEAFTYKYSPRPGTAAEKLTGHLPDEVRQERLERLISTGRRLALASNQGMVGRSVEVMDEGQSRRGRGQHFGRTRGNKPVVFASGPDLRPGDLVRVHVDAVTEATLRGRREDDRGSK